VVGQTRPIWALHIFQDPPADGGLAQPLNLGTATITLHYKVTDAAGNPTGADIPGTNNGVITDAINGRFTFTPAAADTFVTTVGLYVMQWKFDYGSSNIIWGDPFQLNVVAPD
jgi:hypothetical protein